MEAHITSHTHTLRQRVSQDKHRLDNQRMLLPVFPIQLDGPETPERSNVEAFISAQFKSRYDATISHFLPFLLSSTHKNALSAAVGFQPAGQCRPLFLEAYLNHAIEHVLSEHVGTDIDRNNIVEIGNLTSSRRGSSQTLFILITAILHRAGYEWVAFTANSHVQQILSKLEISTFSLCKADPTRLEDKGASWGTYYDNDPTVVAGHLGMAIDQFRQHQVIAFMLDHYDDTIQQLAHKLRHS
jgi:hypothetical protein